MEEGDSVSVGQRIKEARLSKGMTQEQLATALGVTKGAVGNYESETTYPKTEVVYKLLAVLGCDANYLYQDGMPAANDFIVAYPEQELILKLRTLDEYGQQVVRAVLKIEHQRCVGASADENGA